MEKSYWINTDGTQQKVVPENNNDFSLKELNKFVGGHIEIVTLNDNMFMVLNEEGKLDGLPYNPVATEIFAKSYPGTNDYIVGNVLVCHQSLIE